MTFDEVLDKVRELLRQRSRVTYRSLKLRYQLDDELLAGITDELIKAERVAADENGEVLVWKDSLESSVQSLESKQVQSLKSKVQRQRDQPLDARRQTLDSAAERRQLTVMFCDLVDSTALSAQLDPEELREVVRAYQETCTEVIRRYDGHVAQHLGDGLLVYFGYPMAHEDDAARAVRAGLEIIQALRGRVTGNRGQGKRDPFHVRIGIHTGLVVIGEIGSSEKREILALGETPNIAARVQGTANPDEVIISAATYRLVEGLFATEDLGQPDLKGITTPLALYRMIKESEAHSRFEVVVRKGLTPLIGREHEYGLLQERWQRVKDGAGQVVLLSGEPGIGKSRLVEALKETVEREGARGLELRCSPYTQNSAFAPVIEHLQRTLQFRPDDTRQEKLQKLTVGAHSSLLQAEAIPLLAALLSLPHPPDFPALTLSPQKQKEKTQEALVAWLCSEARQHAVTYAWEDLHWVDPSSLELLTLFLQQVPTTRLLAVLTFRPEFIPPWGSHSYLSQLTLSRLGQSQVEVMVEKVAGGKALPREVVRQIASKTDGVPLFVEELTKMVVESNLVKEVDGHYELSGPLPPLAIPSTLQDSLMARLDRLTTVREIAQIGATLGREFTYELLRAVSPLPEDTLQQGLKQLVEAELVFQNGIPPQARYLFKHALVQDTAYQSLLKSRRQHLHQQVARVLVEQFPQTVETQPELVAHHYTEAGSIQQAIPYWQQAGQRASLRSAHVEAINHLSRGLELLKTLPDTPEQVQQELTLHVALGSPLIFTKGYGTPEVEHTYARALELCRRVGETPHLVPVLWGLCYFYNGKGDWQTAAELAEQLMRVAQSTQDPAALILAHRMGAANSYWRGELAVTLEHCRQILTLYDRQRHQAIAFLSASDSEIYSQGYTSLALWSLGYPAQALSRVHRALALARELSHPNSLAFALIFAVGLSHLRRDLQVVQEQAEALIALATAHELPFFLTAGTIYQGWALVEQGLVEEGMVQIRRGLATIQTIAPGQVEASWLVILAKACQRMEQSKEGLAVIARALALVDKGVRVVEAELYRLKGELTLQSSVSSPESRVKEAEEYFLKAVDIAQKQQAKSLELRTIVSLARLWQQQGKHREAHKMLSEIYNWFTEGFDTKDLQEAKALLEDLSD